MLFRNKSGYDILNLNVAGTPISVTRELLTSVKGSLMEEMFRQDNDKNLLRLKDNSIYISSDPVVFN